MLSARYHIATIVAIFFTLGIGIAIGGTLGQQWMKDAEENVVAKLIGKYDQQVQRTNQLSKRIASLELLYQHFERPFAGLRILWIRPEQERNELLGFTLRAAGAFWVEKKAEEVDELEGIADIILVSEKEDHDELARKIRAYGGKAGVRPLIVNVSSDIKKAEDPEMIVNFLLYLRKMIEAAGDPGDETAPLHSDSRLE